MLAEFLLEKNCTLPNHSPIPVCGTFPIQTQPYLKLLFCSFNGRHRKKSFSLIPWAFMILLNFFPGLKKLMLGFALSLHFSPPLHETFQVRNERKIKLVKFSKFNLSSFCVFQKANTNSFRIWIITNFWASGLSSVNTE